MINTLKVESCTQTYIVDERIILIALVFLSYFLFKNLFFKETAETKLIREEKAKKSLEYFENYKKENEEFFFGSEQY